GRAHDRLRRAPRGGRAGRIARRAVAGPGRRGQRRGRLRPRADRPGARAAAAGADRRDQGLRRRHHDRAGPGSPGAAPADRGGGRMIIASTLTTNLSILVLAGFIGFVVISKVPNTLHTPLMSGTNAIHGIVLLGGLLIVGLSGNGTFNKVLLVIAITFGTINI